MNRIEGAAENADAARAHAAGWRDAREPLPHRFEQRRQSPAPVAAEMRKNGRPSAAARSASAATRSSSSTASILLAATTCGFAASVGWNSSQLLADRVEVRDRIASGARDVHEVHQHLGPLEMAQELMAEAEAAVRAFDQPRHVGDDEAAVAR